MGIFYGLLSAAAFGLIPLFTLPLLAATVSIGTALLYRFALATICVGLILVCKKEPWAVGWPAFFKMALLSLFYMLAVILFFHAFRFLPSGIVATLQFQYPVMVMLIMIFFFHERFKWQTGAAIAMSVLGVSLLSLDTGLPASGDPALETGYTHVITGVILSLAAGLCNSLYYVGIKVAKLPKINGLLFTFYIMLFGTIFCIANGVVTDSLQWLTTFPELLNATLLAIVTAVISNLTLILSIRMIGPTLASILGVTEPVTAVATGVCVFGEKMTPAIFSGIILILSAVLMALYCADRGKTGKKQDS